MSDAADYAATAARLLPPGLFWDAWRDQTGRGYALLLAKGDTLAAVDTAAARLLRETRPSTTIEMLGDWEAVFGLPDACTFGDLTLQERRAQIVMRFGARGGQSRAFFEQIAASLGYAITITELPPFRAGVSRCGRDRLNSPAIGHHWRVAVAGPRKTAFRAGVSRCGEALATYRPAYDLECEFRRRKPSWTYLRFIYQEA